MKYTVSIPEIDLSFEVEEGANLLTELILHKVFPNDGSYCGGVRDCGRCAIISNGVKVLSCKTYINCDLTLQYLDLSQMSIKDSPENDRNLIRRRRMLSVDRGKYYSGGKIGVAVDLGTTTIHYAFVELPSGYKKIPDRGKKKENPLKNRQEEFSQEEYYPDSIKMRIAEGLREFLENEKKEGAILEVSCKGKGEEFLSEIRDIFEELNVLKISSSINPQVAFGGDIISRISASLNSSDARETLKSLVTTSISYEICKFLIEKDLYEVDYVVISGNVTMITLLLGEDASSISQHPYKSNYLTVYPKTPFETQIQVYNPQKHRATIFSFSTDSSPEIEKSGEYLNNVPIIHFIPAISTFVGGDFVSGLSILPEPGKGKYFIFIDMGTNTEIGIVGEGRYIVGSAPAGPCFEGGNISCGMRAEVGAIYSYFINENGVAEIRIFEGKENDSDNIKPLGICGSGLIDIIAELRRTGLLEDEGILLNGENPFRVAEDINLSQKDIREFQLAKSAIITGIEILMEKVGIGHKDVENVFVSGGFSEAISIKSLINSGIIPKELSDRCVTLGNTSLFGATSIFLKGRNSFSKIAKTGEYVDFVAEKNFQSKFIENIRFK